MKKLMPHLKKFKPHLIAVGLFIAISAIYFSPVFEGKVLNMPDIIQYKGMSQEANQYRLNNDGEQTQWTGRSFSGMPTYQTGLKSNGNLIQYVDKVFQLNLPRPMNMLFMYLIGFYILLLTLKIDYKLAIVGAIGFAFSSYFLIILQAGHMTKAHAIAYLPLIIASVLYTFRSKKWLLGAVFTSLFVALQLYSNHYQITYYTVIILFFIGIVQFAKELQEKTLPNFFKKVGILVIAAVLGGATNYTRISTTMEYSPYTQRGKSELKDVNGKAKDEGLDSKYILEYSYGKAETMTFLIPNFKGGSMGESVMYNSEGEPNEDSETLQYLKTLKNQEESNSLKNQTFSYWGDYDRANQKVGPGAPTYVGSIIVFLFVLGILYIKSPYKYWILMSTILSVMLGWGYNLSGFSEFFINFIPGYSKFRAVTMVMIIAEFGIALLAILSLNKFLNKDDKKEKEKKLKLAFYITGGITLLFAIIPSLFLDFLSPNDIKSSNPEFFNALSTDRASILKSDAWRSFIFIFLSSGVLWMFIKGKIKKQYVIIVFGVLILFDMWSVDKRYLNETHFVEESKFIIEESNADTKIINNNFNGSRVLDESESTFSSARASYFHNSIGGYSAAKLKRYQELYETYIYPTTPHKNKILGMLNCGWVIEAKRKSPKSNNIIRVSKPSKSIGVDSLGNAWFVSEILEVQDANEELKALSDVNLELETTAIVDSKFSEKITDFTKDKSAIIRLDLESYKPNHLTYNLKNVTSNQLAVFSEIYYEKGWNAYIDDKIVPHFRANYVLRAMMVPAGTTKIEFKFEPTSYSTGESVAYASSIILLLLLGFVSYKEVKRKIEESQVE
jgi:hypothetical protein